VILPKDQGGSKLELLEPSGPAPSERRLEYFVERNQARGGKKSSVLVNKKQCVIKADLFLKEFLVIKILSK
jgi:hypothetical protein